MMFLTSQMCFYQLEMTVYHLKKSRRQKQKQRVNACCGPSILQEHLHFPQYLSERDIKGLKNSFKSGWGVTNPLDSSGYSCISPLSFELQVQLFTVTLRNWILLGQGGLSYTYWDVLSAKKKTKAPGHCQEGSYCKAAAEGSRCTSGEGFTLFCSHLDELHLIIWGDLKTWILSQIRVALGKNNSRDQFYTDILKESNGSETCLFLGSSGFYLPFSLSNLLVCWVQPVKHHRFSMWLGCWRL